MRDLDQEFKEYYNDPRYQRGLKAGQEHSQPSPQTLQLIEQIKKNNNKMENQMIQMQGDISNIKERIERMPTRDEMKISYKEAIEEVFRRTDQKYADKSVEEDIKWVKRLVFGAVILAILGLVIKSNI